MNEHTRTHLTFLLDEAALPTLAAARRRWDPLMARGVPPHVTLTYPEEFNNQELLMDRAAEVALLFGPFTLNCHGLIGGGNDGTGGVFGTLADPTGSWSELRHELLRPPFTPIEVAPHITVVHPRTSHHGPAAWSELHDVEVQDQLVMTEFCLTSTGEKSGMSVRRRFKLEGGSRQLCAAVILATGSQGLLGLRAADRSWYPGVWDLIGGRVKPGEGLKDAACREVNEELGVVVTPADLRHVETAVTGDAETVVFTTPTWIGDPQNLAPDEHQEIRWFDPPAVAAVETSDPRLGQLVASALRHSR